MLTVEAELLLGLWLVSGWRAYTARRLALAFFSLLAGVSLWLALQGQSTCGCLGQVVIHPWTTFAFDVTATCALIGFRPRPVSDERMASVLTGLATMAVGALVLLAVAGLGLMAYWRSDLGDVLARLQGQPLTVEPAVYDLGAARPKSRHTIRVTLTNHTGQATRIVGGTLDCTCDTFRNLPLTIPPYGTGEMEITVVPQEGAGRLVYEYVIFTDQPDGWKTKGRFQCRIAD